MGADSLPRDGVVAVVNGACPTCALVRPVLDALAARGLLATVSEDDPGGLELSWRLGVEAVPTLVRFESGAEAGRLVGWDRAAWEAFFGVAGLGPGLPEWRPGCGARAAEPGTAERLAAREKAAALRSRRLVPGADEDEAEFFFARGLTDGLPVVAPTEERVARMLTGTTRDPAEVVAVVPPDMVPCTVEKVAVNAVMAGCKPEYLPVVLAAVEAYCTDEFNGHGLLCTTYFAGPVVIVNGPIARAIGMNAGVNVLGQGNRANATIGRALQLVVRNVGGGRPGEIDRATLGNPGKYTFCFAEDEEGSPWEPLSVWRGLAPGTSAVTLFAGEGPRGVVDQLSRTPESLARSFAAALCAVAHPKLGLAMDAVLVVSPEHARVFREAGWDRARLLAAIETLTTRPGRELVRGAGGCAEGLPEAFADTDVPKFRPGGLLVVHAGGRAGMFSSIIGGWLAGPTGSQPVTVEVRP